MNPKDLVDSNLNKLKSASIYHPVWSLKYNKRYRFISLGFDGYLRVVENDGVTRCENRLHISEIRVY